MLWPYPVSGSSGPQWELEPLEELPYTGRTGPCCQEEGGSSCTWTAVKELGLLRFPGSVKAASACAPGAPLLSSGSTENSSHLEELLGDAGTTGAWDGRLPLLVSCLAQSGS